MPTRPRHARRPFITLAAMALLAAGCRHPLTLGSHTGRFVGEQSLKRIVPGETDQEWVLAVFGRPKKVETLSGGAEEIWKYQYDRVNGSGSSDYLINSRPERGQTARYLYIQFTGGIVKDTWQD